MGATNTSRKCDGREGKRGGQERNVRRTFFTATSQLPMGSPYAGNEGNSSVLLLFPATGMLSPNQPLLAVIEWHPTSCAQSRHIRVNGPSMVMFIDFIGSTQM